MITRLYQEVPTEKYTSIDDDFMLNFLTRDEKTILATRYQYFIVNVPVTVSLMRNVNQPTLPFWLEESGFIKTDKTVLNDEFNDVLYKLSGARTVITVLNTVALIIVFTFP